MSMKMEIVVFSKNYYDMEGNKGAKVSIYGDFIDNGFKTGISITETDIDFNEHEKFNVFPARYSVDVSFREVKDRKGSLKTGVFFSNPTFMSKVDIKDIQNSK